jgi:hypothetical protein
MSGPEVKPAGEKKNPAGMIALVLIALLIGAFVFKIAATELTEGARAFFNGRQAWNWLFWAIALVAIVFIGIGYIAKDKPKDH